MKQSLLPSILLLLLSTSSLLIAPIHARNKSEAAKSPSPPSPAPGPSNSDCSTIIYSMMDCLSYISIGSNDTKPVKSCCVGIETVLEYNPQCICVGLASSKDMGIELNNTRALAMPTTCKIPIAPPHCGIIPGASTPGASSPGLSPVSPSAGTPKTSPSSGKSPTTSPSSGKSPTTSPSSAESPATLPSSADSPAITATPPSKSGTNNLSVPTLTFVAVVVSSILYISALSN